MSGPEMATRVALLLGGGPAVALFAVGSFVARLNRHRRSRKEFVEEPDFSYYRSPVAVRLVVKGERVALRLVVRVRRRAGGVRLDLRSAATRASTTSQQPRASD
jgi:hypothetical protein